MVVDPGMGASLMHLASLFVPQSNNLEEHLAQTRILQRACMQRMCACSDVSDSLQPHRL